MRGRVVALYAMGFMGMMPWGSLMLGFVAEIWASALRSAIGGSICLLVALLAVGPQQSQWT